MNTYCIRLIWLLAPWFSTKAATQLQPSTLVFSDQAKVHMLFCGYYRRQQFTLSIPMDIQKSIAGFALLAEDEVAFERIKTIHFKQIIHESTKSTKWDTLPKSQKILGEFLQNICIPNCSSPSSQTFPSQVEYFEPGIIYNALNIIEACYITDQCDQGTQQDAIKQGWAQEGFALLDEKICNNLAQKGWIYSSNLTDKRVERDFAQLLGVYAPLCKGGWKERRMYLKSQPTKEDFDQAFTLLTGQNPNDNKRKVMTARSVQLVWLLTVGYCVFKAK